MLLTMTSKVQIEDNSFNLSIETSNKIQEIDVQFCRNPVRRKSFFQTMKDLSTYKQKENGNPFCRFAINYIWRPLRKSWLIPETTEARIVLYVIIQAPQ